MPWFFLYYPLPAMRHSLPRFSIPPRQNLACKSSGGANSNFVNTDMTFLHLKELGYLLWF